MEHELKRLVEYTSRKILISESNNIKGEVHLKELTKLLGMKSK